MDMFLNVLFDLDGTLFDSEKLKAQALSETVERLGSHAPPELYQSVMGATWETVQGHFLKSAHLVVESDEFDSIFRPIYTSLIRNKVSIRPFAKTYINDF